MVVCLRQIGDLYPASCPVTAGKSSCDLNWIYIKLTVTAYYLTPFRLLNWLWNTVAVQYVFGTYSTVCHD